MKKAVILILSALTGAAFGAGAEKKVSMNTMKKSQELADKHLALFLMMNRWVKIKQEGKCLAEYFVRNKYKKIGIYGMSYAGKTLVEELKGTEVVVAYGIDQNVGSVSKDVDILTVDDDLREVDVIVVTAITYFDEIEAQLLERVDCPIVSLEDILYEV